MGTLRILTDVNLRANRKGRIHDVDGCRPQMEYLGREINSDRMTVALSRIKLFTTLTLVHLAAHEDKVVLSKARYESLVGRLSWLASNCYGGRLLMGNLYRFLTLGQQYNWRGFMPASDEKCTRDLNDWCRLIEAGRMRGFKAITRQMWDTQRTLVMSDAAGGQGWEQCTTEWPTGANAQETRGNGKSMPKRWCRSYVSQRDWAATGAGG